MITAATAMLLALLPLKPDVDESPTTPGAVIEDFKRTPPRDAAPVWARVPAPPAPPTYEPDPFFCRPEAPFPNDDCIARPEPAEPAEPDEPEVTPGDVEREVKRIGFPRLRVSVQPAGSTLVNLETIFHTRVQPFERDVDILDSTVALRATPVSYTWHHGDGSTQTTSTPGRPYPAMDVTHQYRKPGPVSPRVDVTYRVTYRIDDADWQSLDTTITAPGPATPLRVREARPVLTD